MLEVQNIVSGRKVTNNNGERVGTLDLIISDML